MRLRPYMLVLSAEQSNLTIIHFNKCLLSLLTLTQVIRMLSLPSAKRIGPIPYRNSKLTRILQPSLNGNSRVAIICCVVPSPAHANETERTLEFALCASKVKTNPQVNVLQTAAAGIASDTLVPVDHVETLNGKLAMMSAELASKDGQLAEKDEEIKRLKAALTSRLLELTLERSEADTGYQETEASRHSDTHLFLHSNSFRVNDNNADTSDDNAVLHRALVHKASVNGKLQIEYERVCAQIGSLHGEIDTLRDANADLQSKLTSVRVEADSTAVEHVNVAEGFVAEIETLHTGEPFNDDDDYVDDSFSSSAGSAYSFAVTEHDDVTNSVSSGSDIGLDEASIAGAVDGETSAFDSPTTDDDEDNFPPMPPLGGADSDFDVFDDVRISSSSVGLDEASSGGVEARPFVGIANPSGNKFIAMWNDRFFELKDFKEKYGHCNVPKKYKENQQLANWVNNQRKRYQRSKKGKASSMTQERIAKLNAIGFEWDASHLYGAQIDDAWEARRAELVAYKEKHGDCHVPQKYEANKQLGTWVSTQRQEYRRFKKGESSSMTDERIAKLESAGFEWDASHKAASQPNEGAWEAKFAELVKYKAEHGDCRVPNKYEANKQLGTWVHRQRQEYRFYQEGESSTMTDERIAKLDAIGFKWKGRG